MKKAEDLRKTRSYGKIRCLNPSCLDRLTPEYGAKTIKCPKCGMEYRLVWLAPDLPRIRGPVWEVQKKITEKILKQKGLK